MCCMWLCVVGLGQLGGVIVQQVTLCCLCETVGGVTVQQEALCLCVGQLGE